jgi:predicted ThiF/HesA family dinucleotide-utilizing enzyme
MGLIYRYHIIVVTKEYIREKMDASDTILDEITRKQLTWYILEYIREKWTREIQYWMR